MADEKSKIVTDATEPDAVPAPVQPEVGGDTSVPKQEQTAPEAVFPDMATAPEQAADRLNLIIRQMMQAEGVTEAMKTDNQMLWVQSMNSVRNRAEEIIKAELIYA